MGMHIHAVLEVRKRPPEFLRLGFLGKQRAVQWLRLA